MRVVKDESGRLGYHRAMGHPRAFDVIAKKALYIYQFLQDVSWPKSISQQKDK